MQQSMIKKKQWITIFYNSNFNFFAECEKIFIYLINIYLNNNNN